MSDRLVLGIETSCDETAASVVRGGVEVLSNVIASQHELHAEYRGVVPEIASRAHVERLVPVVRGALAEAGVKQEELSAVAVGHRPGLIGSLLVGVSGAKGLAWGLGVPVVGVDHVRAHLWAGCLDVGRAAYPALGLVVSGGHTSLYVCESATRARRVGATIDDAIGEAYDKVGTILGLEYPAGPTVDRLAGKGNERAHEFPISRLSAGSLDFSFSGLKTAVLYAVKGVPGREEGEREGLTVRGRADVCASFQRAAVGAVMLKVERAMERHGPFATAIVGGGVSANSRLREEMARFGAARGLEVRVPAMEYCMDNAAMIAGLGHEMLMEQGWKGDAWTLTGDPASSDAA